MTRFIALSTLLSKLCIDETDDLSSRHNYSKSESISQGYEFQPLVDASRPNDVTEIEATTRGMIGVLYLNDKYRPKCV